MRHFSNIRPSAVESIDRNSWLCMYDIDSAESPKPYVAFLAIFMCVFTLVGVPSFVLFAVDLDKTSSDKMLLPSLTTFVVDCLLFVCIFFACVVVLTFFIWNPYVLDAYPFRWGEHQLSSVVTSKSDLYKVCINSNKHSHISYKRIESPSNTFRMQVPKLYFHIAVVWNYLIRILLPLDFGLIIWFGVNLLQLASSSTNFESYVDVFVPLYVAEACGGILLIIMAIFLVRTCHLENDLWVKDCFQYVVDVRARSASISILSLFHVSIMLLESQEYHSYRSLMPQENHSKSNARMRTRL